MSKRKKTVRAKSNATSASSAKRVGDSELKAIRKARTDLLELELATQRKRLEVDSLMLAAIRRLDLDPRANGIDMDTGEVGRIARQPQ